MPSLERTSKRLSFLLRHSTDPLVISLDGGWARVSTILEILHINRSKLDEIVRTDRKTRYAYSADGPKGESDDAYFNKIFGYANYGHTTTYHSNGTVTYNSGSTQNRSTASSGTTSGASTSNGTTASTGSTAIGYSEEVLSHIVESYDAYIKEIKTKVGDKCDALETLLKEKLAAAGIDYDETIGYELKNEVIDIFSTEIKF